MIFESVTASFFKFWRDLSELEIRPLLKLQYDLLVDPGSPHSSEVQGEVLHGLHFPWGNPEATEYLCAALSLHGDMAGERRRKITCSGVAVHAQGCRVPELHMNMTTGLQRLPHIGWVTFAQERSVTFAANVTALKFSCFQAFTPSRHRALRCQRQGFEFRRGAL